MRIGVQNARAILFDLDGTLLDSAPDLGCAANQLRIARKMQPLPLAAYRAHVGSGAKGMLKIALSVNPDAPAFDALKEEFFVAYEQTMGQHSQLFIGVSELIEQLEKLKMPWGIVTNKSQRFTFPIVKNQRDLSRAHVVICGDTTPYSKPHPMPLLEAAKHLGVSAEHCIYVGDDARDMIAARAAHMKAIAAAYGYLGETKDVQDWQPDFAINSPEELLRLLGMN